MDCTLFVARCAYARQTLPEYHQAIGKGPECPTLRLVFHDTILYGELNGFNEKYVKLCTEGAKMVTAADFAHQHYGVPYISESTEKQAPTTDDHLDPRVIKELGHNMNEESSKLSFEAYKRNTWKFFEYLSRIWRLSWVV